MTKIAILGATGYTALELTKLLLRHPSVEITAATSRSETAPISQIHPQLVNRIDLPLENLSTEQVVDRAECVFSCLPHAASAETVKQIVDAGAKVVDFSADYRLRDVETYETWYGGTHPDPDRLGSTPYGLPEWFKDEIVGSQLVANPGCYPTAAILSLAPLLKAGMISTENIIVDSKSGVSGAGRKAKLGTHYPECNESISAYAVGQHRHGPEISQILGMIADSPVSVIFTPHLVPMNRGILSTAYSVPTGDVNEDQLMDVFRETYKDCPFVRIVEHLPHTRDVIHTNYCDITVRKVQDRILTISAEDNLIKGASGAAVQNFNLMFGYPETTALI